MGTSRIIAALMLSALAGSASAQDYLFKKNGEKENVVIKEVGAKTIIYKQFENPDGPEYVIAKREVERIKYQNGTEDVFNGTRGKMPQPERNGRVRVTTEKYGGNILTLSPIALTNTSSTGVGISYERVIDVNSIFSFYIPITYSFRTDDNGNSYNPNPVSGFNDRGKANVWWFYPGVKIYPTGSNRKVSYAIGASIPIATGTEAERYDYLNPQGNYSPYYLNNKIFLVGAMITNYLNIQPTPKLFLGLQLGLGIPYIKHTDFNGASYTYYGTNADFPWAEFSLRVGYRF